MRPSSVDGRETPKDRQMFNRSRRHDRRRPASPSLIDLAAGVEPWIVVTFHRLSLRSLVLVRVMPDRPLQAVRAIAEVTDWATGQIGGRPIGLVGETSLRCSSPCATPTTSRSPSSAATAVATPWNGHARSPASARRCGSKEDRPSASERVLRGSLQPVWAATRRDGAALDGEAVTATAPRSTPFAVTCWSSVRVNQPPAM